MTEIENLISGFSASEIDQSAMPPPRELRPVVLAVSREHRPSTVCTRCNSSFWFRSATDLRCYCRVMHLVVWSKDEPNQLIDCDQLHIHITTNTNEEDEQ